MENSNFKSILLAQFFALFFIIWGSSIHIRHEIKNSKQIDTVVVKQTDTIFMIRPLYKEVTITVYRPTKEECDDNFLVTANGTKIDLDKLKRGEIRYCAVSQDLLGTFPYGSYIYIEGHGEYEVVDTMNKRIENTVDILQDIDKPIFKKNGIIVKL